MIIKGKINATIQNESKRFKFKALLNELGLYYTENDDEIEIIFDDGDCKDVDYITSKIENYFLTNIIQANGCIYITGNKDKEDNGILVIDNNYVFMFHSMEDMKVAIKYSHDDDLLKELIKRGYKVYKDGIKY